MEREQTERLLQQLQLINLAEALERVGGDEELLSEVAGDFLDTCGEAFQAVVRAVETRDSEGLQRSAHSLKGAVRNFGAEETVGAAYRLEMMGRLSEFEGAEAALVHLRTTLEAIRPEMESLAGGQPRPVA